MPETASDVFSKIALAPANSCVLCHATSGLDYAFGHGGIKVLVCKGGCKKSPREIDQIQAARRKLLEQST